jgi:hypothetical protein
MKIFQIAKVYDLTERLKEKQVDRDIQAEMEKLQKALLIPELGKIWPTWEAAFDEAVENEKKFGTERALQILKARCPISLEEE